MTPTIMMSDPRHAMQSLAGLWCLSEGRARELVARCNALDLAALPRDGAVTSLPYHKQGDIAVIPVVGVLTKYPSRIDSYLGFCPTKALEVSLAQAIADPGTREIVLLIDSPGGMVDGTTEFAAALAASPKRVRAVVSDTCASGGYWVAAMCEDITANPAAFIGCIGVYRVHLDDTKWQEDAGLRFVLVSTGGVKGLGADGAVTPELIEDSRREINSIYELFINAVAGGRDMSAEDVKPLADGRSWIATEALAKGLIDKIASADAAMAAIQQEITNMTQEEFQAYATAHPEAVQPFVQQGRDAAKAEFQPKPATLNELRTAFPDKDDNGFVIDQLAAGVTLEQAKVAYGDKAREELRAAKHAADELRTELAKHDPASAGRSAVTTPVTSKTEQNGDDLYEQAKQFGAARNRRA